MRTTLKLALASGTLLAFASLFVHPFGTVKAQRSTGPLLAGAETSPAIIHLVERSCQNCHSERTEWPWYSYVAPVSWLIEHDVHRGRSHMNLARWEDYTLDQQADLLTKLAIEVRNRRMPLPNYLRLHPGANLSDDERNQVGAWAHDERRRLRNAGETKSKAPTD